MQNCSPNLKPVVQNDKKSYSPLEGCSFLIYLYRKKARNLMLWKVIMICKLKLKCNLLSYGIVNNVRMKVRHKKLFATDSSVERKSLICEASFSVELFHWNRLACVFSNSQAVCDKA